MIDEKALRRAFAQLQARVDYLERASGLFVPEEHLDAKNGNPKVKFAPTTWRGADCVGRSFSECPPAFLEVLAEALTYSADHPKPGQEKFVKYNRLDAARARSWARRLRMAPPPAPPADDLRL